MAPRTVRLLASLLAIFTLLAGPTAQRPAQSAGTSTRIYLPQLARPGAAVTTDGFQEVEWARTPYSRVFLGEQDGRTVARVQRFSEPVDYYDAASEIWRPIDTRIVPATGGYRNAGADFRATFASVTAGASLSDRAPPLLTLGRAGEPALAVRLAGGAIPAPHVAGDSITYPDAIAGADIVYTVEPWGVKEEIVLDAADAPASYDLLLSLSGATPRAQPDGSWLVQSAAGETLWRILPPIGADARGVTAPLDLAISPEPDGSYRATLSVDRAWLRDPARAFPVRLDPSFANPLYIGGETYVQEIGGGGTWNQQNRFLGLINQPSPNPALNVVKGVTRIYTPAPLDILPPGLQGDDLIAARLVFTQYVGYSAAPLATSVYPILTPWDFQAISWANQGSVAPLGPAVAGATLAAGSGAKSWDITTWAREVVDGARANNGLSIHADDETQAGRAFRSSTCGAFCATPAERPHLEFEIALDSGLNPALDTWLWGNRKGLPSFEQFARDYGVGATTHLVTETRVLEVLTSTEALTLPISFEQADLRLSIPLSATGTLTVTDVTSDTAKGRVIPRPISYAYEEVLVKAVYDDQFTDAYTAAMEGGLCLGMAATVADLYRTSGPDPDDYGGGATVRSIPDAEAAQDYIQTIHGRQLGSQVMNWLATPGQGRLDVEAYYDRLVARIGGAAWQSDPEIIGIVKGAGCDDLEIGHALLPYKLTLLPDNLARVYVYDPNYPPTSAADAANRYITLDLANDNWTYTLAPGVIWQGKEVYSTPLSLLLEKPVQPTVSGTDAVMVQGGHSYAFGGHSYAFGGHSYAFGEDGTNTHTGCYVSGTGSVQLVQEIERSYRIVPLNGGAGQAFPDAFFLPAGQPMSLNGYGSREGGVGDMMIFGPRALAGALGTLGDSSRDRLEMDAPFLRATLTTQDASKPVTLYQMHETDEWTRVYAVSNTKLGAGESLTVAVSPDYEQMIVVNDAGAEKTFDLGLAHIGSDGVGQITYPDQKIGPGATIIYTPLPWNLLPHAPVLVQIDDNSDGIIDRVEILGGSVMPLAAPAGALSAAPGAEFDLVAHDLRANPGHRGWVAPQWTVIAGQRPTKEMRGTTNTLRAWLADPANPGMRLGDELVGVPGTHGGLIREIGQAERGPAGQVMIVPLYDRVTEHRGGLPPTYRLAGLAVVRPLAGEDVGGEDAACAPQQGCRKALRVKLIARVVP